MCVCSSPLSFSLLFHFSVNCTLYFLSPFLHPSILFTFHPLNTPSISSSVPCPYFPFFLLFVSFTLFSSLLIFVTDPSPSFVPSQTLTPTLLSIFFASLLLSYTLPPCPPPSVHLYSLTSFSPFILSCNQTLYNHVYI